MTPKILSQIADALEVIAGQSLDANETLPGYWERIADAFTTIAAGGGFSVAGSLPVISTVAALAALEVPAESQVRLLGEEGRYGSFEWRSTDQSAFVAADPEQGIYVAPASAPTGASGAWVRTGWTELNVRWFGAALDDDGTTGTDDSTAILAAIALSKSLADASNIYYQDGYPVLIPGRGYMAGNPIEVQHTAKVRGLSTTGQQGMVYFSWLRWADGTDGARIQRYNTTGIDGTDAGSRKAGDGFTFESIELRGGYAGTEDEFHAIRAKARFVLRNVVLRGWSGDGIYAHNDVLGAGEEQGNTNNSILEHVFITSCRDGISREGGDANQWTIIDLDTTGNRRWGKNLEDFLGSPEFSGHNADNGLIAGSPVTQVSYMGNRYAVKDGQDVDASTNAPSGTTADNTWYYYIAAGGVNEALNIFAWVSGLDVRAGGAARYANANGANLILGGYTESGQGPIQGVAPTFVLGGQHGAGIKGSIANLTNYFGKVGSSAGFASPNAAGTNVVSLSEASGLGFSRTATGDAQSLQWMGDDIAFTVLESGIDSNWAFALTGEATVNPIGSRKMNFPNGFGIASKKVFPGTAAPVAGTYAVGDTIINTAPTVGSLLGWRCTVAGTPGTWIKLPGQAAAPATTYVAPAGGATVDAEARASLAQLAVDLADLKTKLATSGATA